MRIKILLSAAVLAVLFFLLLKSKDTTQPKNITTEKVSLKTTAKKSKNLEQQNKRSQFIDKILASVADFKYSDDPYLEIYSLFLEYRKCDEFIIQVKFRGAKPSKTQEKLFSVLKTDCEDLKQQYPFLGKNYRMSGLVSSIQPNSASGQSRLDFFKQNPELKGNEFNEKLFALDLASKNAQIIASLAIEGRYISSKHQQQLKNILQGINRDYLFLINKYTLTRISCQYNQGISCAPTSLFMVQQCAENASNCGLDYAQWFDSYLTYGQKQDVMLLFEFYQNISDSGYP